MQTPKDRIRFEVEKKHLQNCIKAASGCTHKDPDSPNPMTMIKICTIGESVFLISTNRMVAIACKLADNFYGEMPSPLLVSPDELKRLTDHKRSKVESIRFNIEGVNITTDTYPKSETSLSSTAKLDEHGQFPYVERFIRQGIKASANPSSDATHMSADYSLIKHINQAYISPPGKDSLMWTFATDDARIFGIMMGIDKCEGPISNKIMDANKCFFDPK